MILFDNIIINVIFWDIHQYMQLPTFSKQCNKKQAFISMHAAIFFSAQLFSSQYGAVKIFLLLTTDILRYYVSKETCKYCKRRKELKCLLL